MLLQCPVHEYVAKSGDDLRVPFVVEPAGAASTMSYAVSCADDRFDRQWCEVTTDANGQPVLDIHLPSQAPAGTYDVTLKGTDAGSSASDSFELKIEERPCVLLPGPPTFKPNPDGSITVKLTLVSCGNVDVSGSVDVRHSGGWRVEVEQPRFDLELGGEELEVDVTLQPPAGESSAGGKITVEVTDSSGIELCTRSFPLTASPPPAVPPKRALWPWLTGGGVLAVVAVVAAVWISASKTPIEPTPDRGPQVRYPTRVDPEPPEHPLGPRPKASVKSFVVDPAGCEACIAWEVEGASRSTDIALYHDGERVGGFGPEGSVCVPAPHGDHTYELRIDDEPVARRSEASTCRPAPPPAEFVVEFFDARPRVCGALLVWQVEGARRAVVELRRDGKRLREFGLGTNELDDTDIAEGRHAHTYELVVDGESVASRRVEIGCLR